MEKRLLLREENKTQKVKDIELFSDPQKLKLILNSLSWKMLVMLSEKEMYPLEIARRLGIHEQKVYYHIRKLCRAGAVTVAREEEKKGATAKYYKVAAPAFGIELPQEYRTIKKLSLLGMEEQLRGFFREFVRKDGTFDGKIVVGSPTPHGPFKTSARDGHYASHLTFFLGQFIKPPEDFAIKLDVDVKAEKEEKNNLILVGGPGTNLLAEEVNDCLPIKFNMRPSEEGFLFGGLVSKKTGHVYTADAVGIVAKVVNQWDKSKRIIVLAGNKAVGTKACVLALTDYWQKTLKGYRGEETYARVIQGFDLNGDGKVDSIEVLE
ncbi:MAG: helix-turn-helix domain-containing protein [Candidatus Bathyarchaeia archaeon]|jgi:DNA-binding transcriptional ArsR family regulator